MKSTIIIKGYLFWEIKEYMSDLDNIKKWGYVAVVAILTFLICKNVIFKRDISAPNIKLEDQETNNHVVNEVNPDGQGKDEIDTNISFSVSTCEDKDLFNSYSKVDIVGCEVSSFLTGKSGKQYIGEYCIDDDLLTSWQDEKKDFNDPSVIKIKLKGKTPVSTIAFYNGNQKSEDSFKKNCRAKKVTLIINGSEYEIELKDSFDCQRIDVKGELITDEIIFKIDEVYKGSVYDDLCISEIVVFQ